MNGILDVADIIDVALFGGGGCLAEHLTQRRDAVMWAAASKAVVARRQLAVGAVVLREVPFTPAPPATVDAMLQGVRAMGVRQAMGWSDKTEAWRQRVIWLRRADAGGGEHLLPDLSDAALEASLEDWLAPLLPGVTSKSALHRLDGDGTDNRIVLAIAAPSTRILNPHLLS